MESEIIKGLQLSASGQPEQKDYPDKDTMVKAIIEDIKRL